MARPGNEQSVVAIGYGHLRASHADRERVIGTLKAAFVQGRLTKDELDARIGQAFASRTYAELAVATAGISAGPAAARPPSQLPRRQASNAVRWGTSGLFVPTAIAAALALASRGGDGRYEAMGFVIAFVYFTVWLSVGADMLWQWHSACLPTAKMCVRCGHTAVAHRAQASCTARPGPVTLWGHCPCAAYVPPGVSPSTAASDRLAATG
jgi:Domain of unknown function (DUF1707)